MHFLVSTGLSNGLTLDRYPTIAWMNDVHWRVYEFLGLKMISISYMTGREYGQELSDIQ